MSAADKFEQQQNAAMIAEAMGGPSQEEQAAQAAANPTLGKRKGPAKSPAQEPAPAGIPVIAAVSSSTATAEDIASAAVPSTMHRIFFTGRSGVGKSYLANLIGARVLEFNAPLLGIWTGPPPPPAVLAQLIAWANGTYDASAPNTAERGIFVQLIRNLFSLEEFGTANFLAKQLIREAALQTDAQIIAVTDVQNVGEFNTLKEAGFVHYHVAASMTTMASRNKRPRDEKLATHLDGQASTIMQREPQGEKKAIVWSDPISANPCARFYTPEEFKVLFSAPITEPIIGIAL